MYHGLILGDVATAKMVISSSYLQNSYLGANNILIKTFYRSLEKQNQRHSISSSEVRSTSLPSTISLKKFFHQVALELSKKSHQASMRWFRGYGTYLWLSGSSLKKDCMAAIIPFSVPRSVTRSSGHPSYSSTASRK